MNKKYIMAVLAPAIVGGIIFYACNKEGTTEEIITSKIEKNDELITPSDDGWIEGRGDFCSTVDIHLTFFYYDFVISYLDSDGNVKFYFVSQTSELGRLLVRVFLQKVETFRGTHAEFCEWEKEQTNKGNIVVDHKDKVSGEYVGASYTPKEWEDRFGK